MPSFIKENPFKPPASNRLSDSHTTSTQKLGAPQHSCTPLTTTTATALTLPWTNKSGCWTSNTWGPTLVSPLSLFAHIRAHSHSWMSIDHQSFTPGWQTQHTLLHTVCVRRLELPRATHNAALRSQASHLAPENKKTCQVSVHTRRMTTGK